MAHDLVLQGARLLTGRGPADRRRPTGGSRVDGGRVAALGHGVPPEGAERLDVGGDWLAPGTSTCTCTEAPRGDVMATDRELPRRRTPAPRAARHDRDAGLDREPSGRRSCTTAVARLAEDVEAEPDEPMARLVGIHLEGPFLSRVRRGAHQETALRPPDPAEIDALLAPAAGTCAP